MTTEKEYEPKDLIKALEMSGAQIVGNVSTDNARDALILMGLPVKPEKPAPGVYLGSLGAVLNRPVMVDQDANIFYLNDEGVFVEGQIHTRAEFQALTPVRVAPAVPVKYEPMPFDEVERLSDSSSGYEEDLLEAHRMGWDEALAKHATGRPDVTREQVNNASFSVLMNSENDGDRRGMPNSTVERIKSEARMVTDAVMALLDGGQK